MTDLTLNLTVGVVVGQVTSWPRNLPVGQGRGLLAQRYGRYVAGSAGHRNRTPPDLAATLVDRYSRPGDLIVDPFGAQPRARTALRSATRPLLSTALITYAMSTARMEPESRDRVGSGARPQPDRPAPTCRPRPDRGMTGGTTEVVTTTTPACGRQSHAVTRKRS